MSLAFLDLKSNMIFAMILEENSSFLVMQVKNTLHLQEI